MIHPLYTSQPAHDVKTTLLQHSFTVLTS